MLLKLSQSFQHTNDNIFIGTYIQDDVNLLMMEIKILSFKKKLVGI